MANRNTLCAAAVVAAIAVATWIVGYAIRSDATSAKRTLRKLAAGAPAPEGMAQATFGCGCFWCAEAVFQELKGVHSVVSGYSGGTAPNPTYRQVCTGLTGHAEVIQVTYDPKVITYPELLEVFWQTHDPTTKDRQGSDHGTQYRSVVYYHDDEQRKVAEEYKRQLDATGVFKSPIVTEIAPLAAFFPAEDYHQNYFAEHPSEGYCAAVIRPKIAKFEKAFQAKLRTSDE